MIFDEDYIVIEEDTDLDSEIDDLSADEPSTDDIENLDTDESTETSTDAESTKETPEPQDSGESGEVEPQEDDEETISIDTMSDNDIDSFADDLEQDEPEKDQNDYFDDKNPYQVNTNDNNTKPTEIGIDVTMSNFGTDNSPVQNQYDPKEVDRLNTLIASENSAIGEYFQASKETNVDVLRRLYSDIGEEERFHVEQLLFAKSQVTGERYIPRDPDVKREYEELLSMGMDEETAMATAVDKVGLINKNFQISPEESIKTMEMVIDQTHMIGENLYQEFMMFNLLDSSNTYSSRERDNAINTFIEAYINDIDDVNRLFIEGVTSTNNNNQQTQKPSSPQQNKNNGGILKGIGRVISAIISGIGSLFKGLGTFIKRRANHAKTKLAWLKNHKLSDLFKSGFHLYFYNDDGNKVGFAYDEAAKYLVRLINCCIMVAKEAGCNFQYSTNQMTFKQLNYDSYKPATLEDAIKDIKSVQLVKTKVIIDERNSELFLKEAFGVDPSGGTQEGNIKIDGAYAKIKMLFTDFDNVAKAFKKITDDMESNEYKNRAGGLYSNNRDKYDRLIGEIKVITKGFQMFMKCLTHDTEVLEKIDTEFTRVASQDPNASAVANAEQGQQQTGVNPTENNGTPQTDNNGNPIQQAKSKNSAIKLKADIRYAYNDGLSQIIKALVEGSDKNSVISNLEKLKAEIEQQKSSISGSNNGQQNPTQQPVKNQPNMKDSSFKNPPMNDKVIQNSEITIIDDFDEIVQEGFLGDLLTTKIKKGKTTKETFDNIFNTIGKYKSDDIKKMYDQFGTADIDALIKDSQNSNSDPKIAVLDRLISIINDCIKGVNSGEINPARKQEQNQRIGDSTKQLREVFDSMINELYNSKTSNPADNPKENDAIFKQIVNKYKKNFENLQLQNLHEYFIVEGLLDGIRDSANQQLFKTSVENLWRNSIINNINNETDQSKIFNIVRQNCIKLCDQYIDDPYQSKIQFFGKKPDNTIVDNNLKIKNIIKEISKLDEETSEKIRKPFSNSDASLGAYAKHYKNDRAVNDAYEKVKKVISDIKNIGEFDNINDSSKRLELAEKKLRLVQQRYEIIVNELIPAIQASIRSST